MTEADFLLLLKLKNILNNRNSQPQPEKEKKTLALTFIKPKKGQRPMKKSMKIDDQNVAIDSFEATDRDDYIRFTISRTADDGASTGAIVRLFGKPSTVNVVDSDSKVTFTLNDGQISEYRYYTRDNQPALEYFRLEGHKIEVK